MSTNLSHNMSPNLVTVPENMKVEEALMVMKNHHFRHLCVVNSNKEITGLVSDRDLLKALNTEEIELSRIMTKNIRKFDIKTNMKDIVKTMVQLKISALLITRDGKPAGIITSEDMLQLLSQLLSGTEATDSVLEHYLEAAFDSVAIVKSPNLIT